MKKTCKFVSEEKNVLDDVHQNIENDNVYAIDYMLYFLSFYENIHNEHFIINMKDSI